MFDSYAVQFAVIFLTTMVSLTVGLFIGMVVVDWMRSLR